jgi:Tol biopolymer transport system component
LHWDGFQLQWSQWLPDGHHILLLANQTGKGEGVFVTDVNGATPKLISPGDAPWGAVAPDGKSFVQGQHKGGTVVIHSLSDDSSRPLPGVQPGEGTIGWSADSKNVFVQVTTATGINIYKVDVTSGRRELWQTITPKNAVGLRPMVIPSSITPDGRWMAYAYRTQLGQLYRSDTLR